MSIIKEGVIELQKKGNLGKKKWKVIYIIITPGGLHIYADAYDTFPSKSLNIEDATFDGSDKNKSFSLIIKTKDNKSFALASENEADIAAWADAIKQATGQKYSSAPKKTESQRSKGSIMFRAKKNISGKVATSSIMKQKIMNEETRYLLDSLVAVVEQVSDMKTAADVEKQIIKMVLKGYFQYDKGNITLEQFRQIDGVLRKAFNQMDKLFGYYQIRSASQLTEGFSKTSALLKDAADAVLNLLEPHVRGENLAKMKNALNVIANADFLFKVWDNSNLEQHLLALISAMNKYTQIELN